MELISQFIIKSDKAFDFELVKSYRPYLIREKINNHLPLTEEEEDWLTKQHSDANRLHSHVRLFGYTFLYPDILNSYLLEVSGDLEHGGTRIIYSPNKESAIRYAKSVYGEGTAYDEDYEGCLWNLYELSEFARNW